MEVVLPEIKKIRTSKEKVEQAIIDATDIYVKQFNDSSRLISAEATRHNIIEIAKMILREEK